MVITGVGDTGLFAAIWRNNGDGTFSGINAGLQGLLWASAAWGDYDNDGDLDIVVIGYDAVAAAPRSILCRNDGGTFVNSGAIIARRDRNQASRPGWLVRQGGASGAYWAARPAWPARCAP